MKEGEEEKTKTYSALIWTNRAIQKKDIGFLDDLKVQHAVLCLFFFSSAYEKAHCLLVYSQHTIGLGLLGQRDLCSAPGFPTHCPVMGWWSNSLESALLLTPEPSLQPLLGTFLIM
jgi:hypothetical protein